ncbi:MAG: hypothetical protein OEU92_07585, partial [Alphaproteobacteria bacterium]|nr:hypothetical protein [Alphaproteobacteria bacterium]
MPNGIGDTDLTRQNTERSSYRGTTTLPIVPQLDITIEPEERERLRAWAKHLLDNDSTLARIPFEDRLRCGLSPHPSVIFEDHSNLVGVKANEGQSYAYRGLMLAGEGDLFIKDEPRCLAFERYCRDILGLGQVTVATVAPFADLSMTRRILRDDRLLDELAQHARLAGGLNLVPYMASGGAWAIAGNIAQRSGVRVSVAASPPRLTERANDKLWFGARVGDVLGRQALPPAYRAYGPSAMIGLLRWLAKHYPSVAVKLPNSASSEGNFVFESAQLLSMSARQLMNEVMATLDRSGWQRRFPVQVTAWERPILASPSVQLWIPETITDDPVVEGVFEQRLTGRIARFSGAEPSALPELWTRRLAGEAGRLAFFLQQLGYVGRCSFDAIILGEDLEHAELHWIECNGRWGGVSIPMTLINRLTGDWTKRPFVVIDITSKEQQAEPFSDFVTRMNAELYGVGGRENGVIVLSPTRIETGSGHLVAIVGKTIEEARRLAHVSN